MTNNWIETEKDFIEADVIRWTEAIWPARKQKKPRPLGQQTVTGQINLIDKDFVSIKVLKAEIAENPAGARLHTHTPGTTIRKKMATLLKGCPERLLWSDESARDLIDL